MYLSYFKLGQHLVMSADRTLFWEDQSTLIVADLHVGKTGHFRKSGIGVPAQVYKEDLQRLLAQVLFFKAERLIIVGDLTHSVANRELDLFAKWRKDFSSLNIELVKGNHDILSAKWYADVKINVTDNCLVHAPFSFMHDIGDCGETIEGYAFSGHIHPGITVHGKGRQSLSFPCFYFGNEYCVLPAFSRFTGIYRIQPKKGEEVFAVSGKEIWAVQAELRGKKLTS